MLLCWYQDGRIQEQQRRLQDQSALLVQRSLDMQAKVCHCSVFKTRSSKRIKYGFFIAPLLALDIQLRHRRCMARALADWRLWCVRRRVCQSVLSRLLRDVQSISCRQLGAAMRTWRAFTHQCRVGDQVRMYIQHVHVRTRSASLAVSGSVSCIDVAVAVPIADQDQANALSCPTPLTTHVSLNRFRYVRRRLLLARVLWLRLRIRSLLNHQHWLS